MMASLDSLEFVIGSSAAEFVPAVAGVARLRALKTRAPEVLRLRLREIFIYRSPKNPLPGMVPNSGDIYAGCGAATLSVPETICVQLSPKIFTESRICFSE